MATVTTGPFWVGVTNPQTDANVAVQTIAAQCLQFNGQDVVDPVSGGSQNFGFYTSSSLQDRQDPVSFNPQNYLVVPSG